LTCLECGELVGEGIKIRKTWDRYTFGQVQELWRNGALTDEQWDEYCYNWHAGAPKLSDLGRVEAKRHAKKAGKPWPITEWPEK